MIEKWKKLLGYENKYEISSLGNIRSLWYKYGKRPIPKILSKCRGHKGYIQMVLCKNNITHSIRLHRLVALNFLKNTYNKPQVNHKNGIKSDNRINNLEWCTNIENRKHAIKLGLVAGMKKRGIQNEKIINKI